MWFKVYGNVLKACVKPGKVIAVTETMETVVITVAVDSRMVVLAASPVAITPKLPMAVPAEITANPAAHRPVPVDMVANPALNLALLEVVAPVVPVT